MGVMGQSVYAFGQFTFDLSGAEPTVTHRVVHETGKVMFELFVGAADSKKEFEAAAYVGSRKDSVGA